MHQHISREEFAFAQDFFVLFHFHHFFGGYKHFKYAVGETLHFNLKQNFFADFVFVSGLGVDDIPISFFRH